MFRIYVYVRANVRSFRRGALSEEEATTRIKSRDKRIISIISRNLRVTPGDDKQELPRVYWPWQLLFVIARSETKISVYDIDYSLISGFSPCRRLFF